MYVYTNRDTLFISFFIVILFGEKCIFQDYGTREQKKNSSRIVQILRVYRARLGGGERRGRIRVYGGWADELKDESFGKHGGGK